MLGLSSAQERCLRQAVALEAIVELLLILQTWTDVSRWRGMSGSTQCSACMMEQLGMTVRTQVALWLWREGQLL